MRLRLSTADLERGLQELGWLQQQVTKGGREGPLAAAGTWASEGIVLHHLARVRHGTTYGMATHQLVITYTVSLTRFLVLLSAASLLFRQIHHPPSSDSTPLMVTALHHAGSARGLPPVRTGFLRPHLQGLRVPWSQVRPRLHVENGIRAAGSCSIRVGAAAHDEELPGNERMSRQRMSCIGCGAAAYDEELPSDECVSCRDCSPERPCLMTVDAVSR